MPFDFALEHTTATKPISQSQTMLAARDQENLVYSHQAGGAAKQQGTRHLLPKTPGSRFVHDENAVRAGKSVLGDRTAGRENALKKSGKNRVLGTPLGVLTPDFPCGANVASAGIVSHRATGEASSAGFYQSAAARLGLIFLVRSQNLGLDRYLVTKQPTQRQKLGNLSGLRTQSTTLRRHNLSSPFRAPTSKSPLWLRSPGQSPRLSNKSSLTTSRLLQSECRIFPTNPTFSQEADLHSKA